MGQGGGVGDVVVMLDRPGIRKRPAVASPAWARQLPIALLSFLLIPQSLRAAPACRALQEQRDQLATRAMQAEIALVQTIRRRLCPREEALAEQANAIDKAPADSALVAPLDIGAYIRCREQAERLLGRTRPVLYRNQQKFLFYTAEGARLARAADDLAPQLSAACTSPQAQPSP